LNRTGESDRRGSKNKKFSAEIKEVKRRGLPTSSGDLSGSEMGSPKLGRGRGYCEGSQLGHIGGGTELETGHLRLRRRKSIRPT